MSNSYSYASSVSMSNPTYKVEISTADGFIDFTNNIRSIETQATCRSMTNQFRLYFVPREDANADNIYNLIEPMSYVRIQLKRQNDDLTTVMRGFITSIEKSFDISGGTPQRIIAVNGDNYGKLIAMTYIHYILGLDPAKVFAAGNSRWPLAAGWGVDLLTGKTTPSQFVQGTFDKFIKPTLENVKQYIANRSGTATTYTPFNPKIETSQKVASHIDDFLTDIDVAGVDCQRLPTGIDNPKTYFLRLVDPSAASADTGLYEFITQYYGAPWNEIFIDDAPENSYLVYRPFPYRDRDGGWVGSTAFNGKDPKYTPPNDRTDSLDFIDIQPDELISYNVTRSDEEIYNYFFTDAISSVPGNQFEIYSRSRMDNLNPHFTADLRSADNSSGGSGIFNTGGIGFSGPNQSSFLNTPIPTSNKLNYSRLELFGFRKYWQATKYLSINPQNLGDTETIEQFFHSSVDPNMIDLGDQLNMILFNAMEHNGQLERGMIVIKGREDIRPGMYITFKDERQDTSGYMFYVTDVFHSLTPYDGNFITRLTVSRGESHLNQVDDRY